jgi:hypothetical protein
MRAWLAPSWWLGAGKTLGAIPLKSRMFLYRRLNGFIVYGGMNGNQDAGMDAGSLVAASAGAVGIGSRRTVARLEERRAKSKRLVIVSSLFVAFIATAMLAGGRAMVDPLKAAVAVQEARGSGDIVYTMPDGVYCRHMSFDNTTATVVEGGVERCRTDIVRGRSRVSRGFAWGTH